MPISKRSLKPEVINNAVFEPLCSSKAFVAIVVPIRTLSIFSKGIFSSEDNCRIWRIPAITESSYDVDSERTLEVCILPKVSTPITSVKVPPLSTAKNHLLILF